MLQETHNASENDEKKWTAEWGGQTLWSRGTNRSCGTAVFFNPKLDCDIDKVITDNEGRVLAAKVFINDIELNITSIYAPTIPRQRKQFFDNLWQYKTGTENFLFTGDFNCIEDISKDKLGGNPTSGTIGLKELTEFTQTFELADIWRLTHKDDRIYTWHNKDFTIRSRLDRWYIPQPLVNGALAHIRACPFSDHSLVELILHPPQPRRRGRGKWKMNTTILTDKQFYREMKAFLLFWKDRKSSYANAGEWWEECKRRIKVLTIKHCVRKSRNKNKQTRDLQRKLTQMKADIIPNIHEIQAIE